MRRASFPMTRRGWQALGALHAAVLLFGVAGLFGKWIAADALFIVFGRVTSASVVLGVLLALRGPRLHALRGRDAALLPVSGALLAFHWFAFFHAIRLSSVAIGVLGYATAPLFVVLLEPLWFREPLSRKALLASAVAMAGVALIVPRWHSSETGVQGLAWGVAAGLSFAALSLCNRDLTARHNSVALTLRQDAVAALLLAPLAIWYWQPVAAADLLLVAALGVFCTALAHTLFVEALKVVRARTAALAGALEPVYAITLAAALLEERPAPRELAGGALILLAVIWVTLAEPALRSPPPQGER